jgi:tRNA wybutosine-synthesizing protein 3
MSIGKQFLDGKENALRSLDQATKKGEVDEAIVTLLSVINNSKSYYTSSSCAGRILLIELPALGDKRNAVFLGRWHRIVTVDEIQNAVIKARKGMIWLLAQAPIFHIIADSLEVADSLVKTANSCGLKNSSIRYLTKKIIVELASTERLDSPVGCNGHLLCSEEYLEILVDIANEVMERSQEKIKRFEIKMREL